MTIRNKLFLLILGIFGLFTATGALYFFLLSNSNEMDQDKGLLTHLGLTFEQETVAVNRIASVFFADRMAAFDTANHALGVDFENLKEIRAIDRLNDQVKAALDVVKRLKALTDQRVTELSTAYGVVLSDADKLYSFPQRHSILEVVSAQFSGDALRYYLTEGRPHVLAFFQVVESVNDALAGAKDTLAEQTRVIDEAVRAARGQATIVTLAAMVTITLLVLLAAIVFTNGIAKRIVNIERTIAQLEQGDLTVRSAVVSHDEIGTLSQNLNRFTDSLASSIRQIGSTSKSNLETRSRLLEASQEAESAVTEIEANTASIGGQIQEVDGRIAQAVDSVDRIGENITALNHEILSQTTMTEQSTAAVSQMIQWLGKMNALTNNDRKAVLELVRLSEQGRTVFEEASNQISEVPQHVGTIVEMASVIKGIASQTNLLAMNAAIEAAHAGEAGRGFAVVAEEIRKLSEESNASSRDIAESIQSIVLKIEQVSKANIGTSDTFSAIDERIQSVSRSMDDIYQAIEEVQLGSREMLSAMNSLNERSSHVSESARSIEESSGEIRQSMSGLSRVSSEVAANISEITLGIRSIGGSIREVSSLSHEVGQRSDQLDQEVARFRLD